jgi:hypothetical protein
MTDFALNVPLAYIETSIPPGMTIDEYRASRRRPARRWRRLRHALGLKTLAR